MSEDKKQQQRIYNGLCKANEGFRQVLVSDKMVLRPVVLRMQQGYIAKRATIQVEPMQGDYLFKIEWRKDEESDSIKQWQGEAWVDVDINQYSHLWKELTEAHAWTVQFLARSELGESYMPWEGQTLAEKAKDKRARNFLKTWHIREFKTEDFVKSPKDGLQYDPQVAPEGLLERIPTRKTLDIHGEVSLQQEHWYMDIGHRIVKVQCDFNAPKALKDIIPNTVKTLICITEGAYEREGAYEGMTAYVYTLG